ncbi:MAG: DUF1254 domain-containing protein [Pirellulales bacterium]|nr:DUF1254 domain-containing protein [Pirellulales bacterium]
MQRTRSIILASLFWFLVTAAAYGTPPTPGYNQHIPAEVLTPETVDTRIGTLKFFDGLPDDATVETIYDNLDFLRGTEAFLQFIPAASLEALREGAAQLGSKLPNQVVIMDRLLDSNPLFLTGNTDTVYAMSFLDLERDGPTVIEIPPGCGPGTVNDAFFRFVTDMGAPGPDRGKGGKYLILPEGFEGDVPEGYFVASSPSAVNWLILRGMLKDGKPDAASKNFREGLKVYPLKAKENPPKMEFMEASEVPFNTIHANNYKFFEEINNVIQKEPIDFIDPELRGLLASLGMQKGKPFQPDARMQKILTEAVAVGNATARALSFKPRSDTVYIYDEGSWYTAFDGGDYRWLIDDGKGGRNLDARAFFFYIATVNTPAMVKEMIGVGSQYALNALDTEGAYLDGSQSYKLNIPKDVPAKDFWSIVVYDPQTRSELQTAQPFPSRNSRRDQMQVNEDGSVDIYFGPKPPAGKESNWIQTVPGKGWFLCLRLYGPLKPWFDKSWRPGEIEKL